LPDVQTWIDLEAYLARILEEDGIVDPARSVWSAYRAKARTLQDALRLSRRHPLSFLLIDSTSGVIVRRHNRRRHP